MKNPNVAEYYTTTAELYNSNHVGSPQNFFPLFDDCMTFQERNEYHKKKIDETLTELLKDFTVPFPCAMHIGSASLL